MFSLKVFQDKLDVFLPVGQEGPHCLAITLLQGERDHTEQRQASNNKEKKKSL